MPKQGTDVREGLTELDEERIVLKRLTADLDIHTRDLVILKTKKSSRHREFRQEDPSTWDNRRYLFKRDGAIYELYLDVKRAIKIKPGTDGREPELDEAGNYILLDDDEVGKWAEATLVAFPTEEMAVRFAQIAARRAARGGQKRIIPVGHPDYDGSHETERPDDRGVKLKTVSIEHLEGDESDLMEGSAPTLGLGEELGETPENRTDPGDIGPDA